MRYLKFIAAFGVWVFLSYALPVWAKTLLVPGQFKTVSAALQAATDTDEVLIAPGVYTENLVLKKGVILRSQGSDEERKNFIAASRTIIQSPGVENQLVLGAEGAVLDGFTLKDTDSQFDPRKKRYGILIDGVTMSVSNCIIASLPYSGLGIKGPTPGGIITIKNNRIYKNSGDGISCEEESNVQIEACDIYLNELSGVHNSTQSQINIKHNKIHQNGVDGIMNSGFAKPLISENEIYKNGLNGIGLQKFSQGRVVSNKIWGNKQAGIGLRMKAECTILNNTIYENLIGIGLMDIKEAVIESNKISANHMVGIGLMRCQGGKVIVRKNDLRGNRIFPISPNLACELTEEDNKK